jgi:hypothetical protein
MTLKVYFKVSVAALNVSSIIAVKFICIIIWGRIGIYVSDNETRLASRCVAVYSEF